jgi:hypothetical protein
VSKQEPSAAARTASMQVMEYLYPMGIPSHGTKRAKIARIFDAYAAARVAEAVEAERERIVAELRENIARHKEAFDLHRVSHPLIANEHNAARWGLKKAIAIVRDKAEQ